MKQHEWVPYARGTETKYCSLCGIIESKVAPYECPGRKFLNEQEELRKLIPSPPKKERKR